MEIRPTEFKIECRLCLQVMRWAGKACSSLLVFALCGVAYADNALEQWRNKAGEISMLAENDAQRAYAEAERLQAALPADATPTDRARLLNLLSRIENILGETDISAAHAQQAFDLAKQHGDKAGQAEADITIAMDAVNQGNIDAMVAADTHSLAILDGVDRPDLLAEAMLRGSMMYTRMEMPEESVAIAVQAMEIARRGNDDRVLAYAYQGMAVAFDQNARYAEARDHYAEMLKHARALHSKVLENTALIGMGTMLSHLGDHQGGERLIRSAIELCRTVGAPFYLGRGLFVLAENLRKQGRFAEALPLLNEDVVIYQQRSNKIGLWWTLYQRSENYLDLGKITQADADAQDAYRLAEDIKFPIYLSKSARRLSAIFAARGDYRQAYGLGVEADALSAKAAGDNAGRRIVELTKGYQTESRQREIDKLSRRNRQQGTELKHRSLERRWLWTVLGGSIVMLAGTAFFLLRLRRSNRRLETLNMQVLQAKNKLQATLDTIPDLLFEVGLDGRYYDYHSPRTELLSAPFDDLHGKTVADTLPANAAEILMSALREAHDNGLSTGKQFQLPLTHGNFWFELSIAGKPAVLGGEPRFIVLSRNITERKQMEAQALLREQEFRVLVESSPDLIFRYDKNCHRIYVNPAVARLVGRPTEALLNQSPMEAKILSADDADKLMRIIRQVLSTGRPAESEVECMGADGQLHYFHNRYAPEFSAHGKVVSVISIARDITERKQAESALRESEQRYRLVFENSPVSIWEEDFSAVKTSLDDLRKVGITDIESYFDRHPEALRQCIERVKIVDVNQAALALHGATSKEELCANLSDTFIAESFVAFRQELISLWNGETEMRSDAVVKTLAGELRDVTVHFTICPGYEDSLSRVLVSIIDITERKRAEEALIARERDFRMLAESLPDNIIRYDRKGRGVYTNRVIEKTLGIVSADMFGLKVRELFPNGEYDDYGQILDNVLANGENGEIERKVFDRDGAERIHNIRIVAEYGENGEVIGALTIGRDITERKQTEQRLWLMDFALNQVCEAVYIVNLPDLRLLNVNAEACRALGYSREELLTMTVFDIDPDADHEEMQSLQHEIDAAEVTVFERRHKAKDGRIFPVEINAKVFEYEGRPTSIALARDMTERKRAQHDIALMSHALNKVHEAAYMMDDDARFLYVNDESCRALGYSRDELLTMSVMDIGPGWTLEMVNGVWQRQHEAGAAQAFEATHRRKDGSAFPVEINANQFEYDGKTYGLALVRDISERKRTEDEIRKLNADLERRVLERTEELRQQTRYLRTLIDTLPMMAWLKDRENRFLVVNQALATASSYEMEDLVGKSDLDCWPREYAESYRVGDLEVMETGLRKTAEELFVDAGNTPIWVESFKAPVLDEDGSILGTVGIARDISDRKAMETARDKALAEAERLAQLRSEFMARMSHELRTPLNGIMGYAQILLGESRGNERHRVMLKVIQQSGEYLLNLINDILDFAKIEAGKQELSLGDILLPRFLRNLAGIIAIKAEQKGLAFVYDIAVDVPAGIRADEKRLRQVLLNLLSNAVKYSERGQISLTVTVLEPGRLRFEVQDSGIGIDAGQLETIFHAFEQAGDRQYRTGGTGLGLPISRELVRMMGSDIHVISQIGEGSTFWFDLDIPVVELRDNIVGAEQPIIGYRGSRRRVLVVDDVNENRALLIDALSGLGFETFEAANGRACLDNVGTQMPDLILLDRVMSEMDGLETVRRLRRLPGFGKTPIIAVSAATDIAEAMKAGVTVFLAKPIDMKRLMAQLAALLKLDWIYELSETEGPQQLGFNGPLVTPPLEEMSILHRLALEGSMRDIIRQVGHLEELDPRYSPFAAQLRALAQGYQSKAILDLVERYINSIVTTQRSQIQRNADDAGEYDEHE
ncbi:MAG: PAS domain S-box protein [Gammaproteobacteria bacterium]